MLFRSLHALLVGYVLALTSVAHAHGGRPQTYDVLFGADANDLVVPATFGVMSSTDGGAHWDWLCIEGMPDARRGAIRPAVRAPEDRIVFAQHFGLMIGAERDCAPEYDTDLRERYVADVVARPGGGYAAVSSDSTVPNSLYVSATGLEPFTAAGATFPLGFLPERVRFSESDPMTVYVSGETPIEGSFAFTGTLFVSHDGGASWEAHDVPLDDDEHVLRALAVDPTDPDHLFLVAQSTVTDRVIEATGGGVTLATALSLMAVPIASDRPMVLAFAADGVWLGNTESGLYRIDATGDVQTIDKYLRVACIVPRGDDLYLCGDGLDDDFALGVQRIGTEYAPTPLMVFSQLDAQRLCGTELDSICAGWWNDLLLDTGRAELIPDASVDPDAGVDAAAPDASLDGGAISPPPSSCACRAASGGPRVGTLALLLTTLFCYGRRRR